MVRMMWWDVMWCDATFAQDFGQPSPRAAILDKIIAKSEFQHMGKDSTGVGDTSAVEVQHPHPETPTIC